MTKELETVAWRESWEDVKDQEGEITWSFELAVSAADGASDARHCFIAAVTIFDWEQVKGTDGKRRDDWEPTNARQVHRSEHYSVIGAVKAAKSAARRAIVIRLGYRDVSP